MPRYKRLGYVEKKKGLQSWEFHFDYSQLDNQRTEVEVFVLGRPKKSAIAEINRLRAKNKAQAKQAIQLRRALLTLSSAHELELEHIYGEMDSLWNAREVVSKFIREGTQ